jgi:proline iminopeptidase
MLLLGMRVHGFQTMSRLRTSSAQAYIESLEVVTPSGGSRLSRTLRQLHPGSGSRETGRVEVGAHSLYYQVHGSTDPDAPVALFLHGGPGAGCASRHATFFAPDAWRVVLVDQRGCGLSSPADKTVASTLRDNTLPFLVGDCEALRAHLNIDRWALVLGGSWGTTLALAYAQAHPTCVRALLLRGMCTMRRSEVLWMFGAHGGAAQLNPVGFGAFAAQPFVSDADRAAPDGSGVVRAYARALAGDDAGVAGQAAGAWMSWESQVTAAGPGAGQLPETAAGEYLVLEYPARLAARAADDDRSSAEPDPELLAEFEATLVSEHVRVMAEASVAAHAAVAVAEPPTRAAGSVYAQPLLTASYCVQALDERAGGLVGATGHEGGLLNPRAIGTLREHNVRCVIVQGLRDTVCPPTTAFELCKLWPEAQLQLCPSAGHSMYSPAILSELVRSVEALLPVRALPPVEALLPVEALPPVEALLPIEALPPVEALRPVEAAEP